MNESEREKVWISKRGKRGVNVGKKRERCIELKHD